MKTELFLFTAVILLGVITSYEDLKEGKIRNKWILAALIFSLFIFIVTIIFEFRTSSAIDSQNLILYFTNIVGMLILGVVLWKIGFWPAGDAKLALAFSALIPLGAYNNDIIPHVPSLVILINTFSVFSIFFIFGVFLKTSTGEKMEAFKKAFSFYDVVNVAFFIFGFSWLVTLLISELSIPENFFIHLAALMLLLFIAQRALNSDLKLPSIALSALHIIFEHTKVLTVSYISTFIIMLFVFMIILRVIPLLSFSVFSRAVPLSKLQPGMVVAEQICYDTLAKTYQKFPAYKLFSFQIRKNSKIIVNKELSPRRIRSLILLSKSGKLPFSEIRVHETLPFAPLLFFGVLLTLSAKGNVLFILFQAMEKFL